jgi:glutathione synthase/RimK-type ligase-like ATP-grasp enzyme
MSRRILITRAGSGPCNNLMRSLERDDASTVLIGCNFDRFVLKQSPAQRNFLVAPPEAEGKPSCAFDRDLRAVIERAAVDLVIPGNDDDALLLAQLHEREPLPCRTFLPAHRTIALCHDKYALYELFCRHEIPVATTYPVSDRASLEEAWRKLAPRELAWCRIRHGCASVGATMVSDADQAWHWISYWNTMRGVPVEHFTLCEFLPGRDYNVQGIWFNGRLVLIKMCERLSYLNATQNPSGMASTPALAKTVWEPRAIAACEAAMHAVDPQAHGIYFFDMKENAAGVPCVTEINACRFAMITNIHDLVGRYNMAGVYARLGCGETVSIADPYDAPGEYYLIREFDTLPGIFPADELFKHIERV